MLPPQLLLFWDYDTQWGADRSRAPGGPKNWGTLEFENTEHLLELHAQYRVPACFAVVGSAALPGRRPYHDPRQIRRIHAAGHEIASHSHRHEWLPGLSREELLETLASSRDALQQCLGAEVASFVPPYNQPWDHPPGLAFSLSERREARKHRVNLSMLCSALRETGYRFCRVAYQPLTERALEYCLRRRLDRPQRLEAISGITCVRLNTPCGFGEHVRATLERYLDRPGTWAVYGHPHSITNQSSPQFVGELERLLVLLDRWRAEGRIRIVLPRDLLAQPRQHGSRCRTAGGAA